MRETYNVAPFTEGFSLPYPTKLVTIITPVTKIILCFMNIVFLSRLQAWIQQSVCNSAPKRNWRPFTRAHFMIKYQLTVPLARDFIATANRSARGFPTIIPAFQNHNVLYSHIFFCFGQIICKPPCTPWSTNLQKNHSQFNYLIKIGHYLFQVQAKWFVRLRGKN